MASFERRFLTIEVTKSVVHGDGIVIVGSSRYVYFYLWFVVY